MVPFEQIRTPLLFISIPLALYGAYAFWTGKQAMDTNRRDAYPIKVTLDQLMLNPPKQDGGWYTVTTGTASLLRGYMITYGLPGQDPDEATTYFYYPVLRSRDIPQHENVATLDHEKHGVFLIIRSKDRSRSQLFRTMMKLKKDGAGTANTWVDQNRKELVISAPFTGTLARPSPLRNEGAAIRNVIGEVTQDCRILVEGDKPPLKENPQVTLGLALLMGVPTLWLFTMLITGKLAPPDEDILPSAPTPADSAPSTNAMPAPTASTSAMPIIEEDVPNKKSRR